jgi:hypothetical protein
VVVESPLKTPRRVIVTVATEDSALKRGGRKDLRKTNSSDFPSNRVGKPWDFSAVVRDTAIDALKFDTVQTLDAIHWMREARRYCDENGIRYRHVRVGTIVATAVRAILRREFSHQKELARHAGTDLNPRRRLDRVSVCPQPKQERTVIFFTPKRM